MSESTRLIIVLAVMVLAAAFSGPRVVREALERDKIYGGVIPRIMTYIGAFALGGLLPGILLGVILGIVHQVAPIALSLLATIFVSLIVYTAVEFPARQRHAVALPAEEDDLWTAEKARTSGL
ncbi:MAG TPA: hypothetical protein VHL11_10215 [Phototrophicaceae bacterium]|jgi:hypothetical protein|nr:hypothetical protein [Phototrophicaceae bacterium]